MIARDKVLSGVLGLLIVFAGPWATAKNREQLFRDGVGNKLEDPAERAQFYLNLCQPRKAWAAAQTITDGKQRKLFEGTILALSSVAHPARDIESELERPAAEESDMVYKVEQAEIWEDEINVLAAADACQFPQVAADKKNAMMAKAKTYLAEATENQPQVQSKLAALASDLELYFKLTPEQLAEVKLVNFEYYDRLKFLTENQLEKPPEYKMDIKKAAGRAQVFITEQTLIQPEFTPHYLSSPWLLNE